jgi:hypothetical protein
MLNEVQGLFNVQFLELCTGYWKNSCEIRSIQFKSIISKNLCQDSCFIAITPVFMEPEN